MESFFLYFTADEKGKEIQAKRELITQERKKKDGGRSPFMFWKAHPRKKKGVGSEIDSHSQTSKGEENNPYSSFL